MFLQTIKTKVISGDVTLRPARKMSPRNKFNSKRVTSVTVADSDGLSNDDSVKRAMKSCLEQFLLETSLHGMKHIARKNFNDHDSKNVVRLKTIIGNYLWIFVTISGALFALYMMNLVWIRFVNTPTVTTVETINNPISEVPFPAVTICNINKVHYPNTEGVRQILKSNGIDDANIMFYLGNLSRIITMDHVDEMNVRVEYLLERLGYDIERIMKETELDCSGMLFNCSWLGVYMPCNQLFRLIKSSQGFCCSFNYNGLRDSYDTNYDNFNMSSLNGSTLYVSGAGENVGLIFKVNTQPKYYVSPTENYNGAEIMIHSSMDYPDMATSSSVVQPGEDLRLGVIPEVIYSKEGIRNMDVIQRDCWFEDEEKLILSKKYSFESCMAECRAMHGLQLCHCMQFTYPLFQPPDEDGYIRQCGLRDLFCLRRNRHILFSLMKPSERGTKNLTGMDCNCLPSCSTILYKVDPNVGSMIDTGENDTSSIVYVFFKDLTCIKYRRDPFMNWDGLFASFGGIFGLCLGGSIISLIEIIYFMTFKFYTTLQKFKHEFRFNYLKKLIREKRNETPIFNVMENSKVDVKTMLQDKETKFLWKINKQR
uniref:CSON009762 protein n=1 Tax=Culicoides sonorensis TaxID=179676 RepID=A0A336KF41_CULSO